MREWLGRVDEHWLSIVGSSYWTPAGSHVTPQSRSIPACAEPSGAKLGANVAPRLDGLTLSRCSCLQVPQKPFKALLVLRGLLPLPKISDVALVSELACPRLGCGHNSVVDTD
jgi:hypothetical protein